MHVLSNFQFCFCFLSSHWQQQALDAWKLTNVVSILPGNFWVFSQFGRIPSAQIYSICFKSYCSTQKEMVKQNFNHHSPEQNNDLSFIMNLSFWLHALRFTYYKFIVICFLTIFAQGNQYTSVTGMENHKSRHIRSQHIWTILLRVLRIQFHHMLLAARQVSLPALNNRYKRERYREREQAIKQSNRSSSTI